MSAPAESGPTEAKNVDRRMSLGKYVKRMSSVFKREKGSKSSNLPVPSAPADTVPEHPLTQEEVTKEAGAPAA